MQHDCGEQQVRGAEVHEGGGGGQMALQYGVCVRVMSWGHSNAPTHDHTHEHGTDGAW